MKIAFQKIHGTGNDFILIDNRRHYFKGTEQELFARLCHRHFGIGADGLMLVEVGESGRFSLQFFNPDGKPAPMCGNGARTAVYFVSQLQPGVSRFRFRVWEESYLAELVEERLIRIHWPRTPRRLAFSGFQHPPSLRVRRFMWVHSGVPHLVLEMEGSLENLEVQKWGSFFRYHPAFSPEGTNVNFIHVIGAKVWIRTYERGVEGETLSCGTGSLAVAFALEQWMNPEYPLNIIARGGVLRIGKNTHQQFYLEGAVQPVFRGEFELGDFLGKI